MMTDMMVDVETTGTDPHTSAILQIAAIKFNYRTGEIGPSFNRVVSGLPFRGWNEETRGFWLKNKDVFNDIVARMEKPIPVFHDFAQFAMQEEGYRFWSKPLSFDWPIIASHFTQLGGEMPFFYRHARDLNTFIAGLRGIPEHTVMENVVVNHGDVHNALHDCAYQIDCLMAAKAGNFAEIIHTID